MIVKRSVTPRQCLVITSAMHLLKAIRLLRHLLFTMFAVNQNMFKDNKDGTITDEATNLIWMTADSGFFMVSDVSNGTLN